MNFSLERDESSQNVNCVARKDSNESTEILMFEPEIMVAMYH
jgi:hypothetical protein